MPRFDATTAECRVFTFKEGLLSAVAHDLELDVRTFGIELSEDRTAITATFDARSIRVVDAVVDGRLAPGTLSAKDKAKIESNVVSDVLPVSRHPGVRFVSTAITARDAGWEVKGELTLAGRSRAITVPVHRKDGRAIAEFTLHQPDFGIKPYSAMLGTLKLQADVKVRLSLPLPAGA